jgi:8-oxo-dGTP pyrophosphatase MutT (NUDIX family)
MRWIVSVKGVVYDDAGRILLAYNERQEWELPGGQLEEGESPEQCVAREILEESGLRVDVGPIICGRTVEVIPTKFVVMIVYRCKLRSAAAEPVVSDEHAAIEFIDTTRLPEIPLPSWYREAIAASPLRAST